MYTRLDMTFLSVSHSIQFCAFQYIYSQYQSLVNHLDVIYRHVVIEVEDEWNINAMASMLMELMLKDAIDDHF